MSEYTELAYAKLNRWIAEDLELHNVMNRKVTFNGKDYPTMIPAGQQPEVNDSTSPMRQQAYIVYGLANEDANREVYRKNGGITYSVFAPTAHKVSQVLSCIQDLTSRLDWSLDDVNDYFEPNSNFHFIELTFEEISGPDPVHQEGGRYSGMVGLTYSFMFNNMDGKTWGRGVGRQL